MQDVTFNPFTLDGKEILVTGASSGIGRAIAVACSRMGASAIITGRNAQRLEETKAMLYSEQEHSLYACDLSNAESIDRMIQTLPKLDGIVHCAGIGHRKPCKGINANDIDTVMDINFKSVVLLQAKLLQEKKVNKGCSIVMVASRAANAPSVGNAIYSASKGALLAYAKCLALELAPRQIRVNSICPAMVWTPLILEGGIDEEQLKEAEQKYPIKRYGKPDDVANLALYLLSDASSWMTGSDIDLTGGAKEL